MAINKCISLNKCIGSINIRFPIIEKLAYLSRFLSVKNNMTNNNNNE